jgi:nucleotide-binding universal stress UspA family protein
MPLKDILVHLDAGAAMPVRLDLALALARQHGAHLTAIAGLDLSLPVGLTGDAGGFAALSALQPLIDQIMEERRAEAATLEARFRDALRREGLEGEWRLVEALDGEALALHARYADLVVLGQPGPDSPPGARAAVEQVLFSGGRPVLVVPYAGRFAGIGRHVLIGWDAGREAARALHDALPLIARAAETTVLAVNPRRGIGGHGDLPAADIALHLARHGLKETAMHTRSEEVSPGDVLLNHAADTGADLLVVGAYGHSRLREMVVGGVTRTLLDHMTLPVLMAH